MYRIPNQPVLALSVVAISSIGREGLLGDIARVITQSPPDDRDLHGLPQMGKRPAALYRRAAIHRAIAIPSSAV